MQGRSSRYREFIVRVVSRPADTTMTKTVQDQQEKTHTYDAFVYGKVEEPGLAVFDGAPPDQPSELRDLQLLGAEKIVVNWTAYRKYKSAFFRGENAASELLSRDEIFREVSPGLKSLLNGEAITSRPLRIWWTSASPALVHLPWELLAYGGDGYAGGKFYFVRGLPPEEPVPKLPVSGNLRLAFIHEPNSTPVELIEALRNIPGIDVTDMTHHPLQALQDAARDGFELVHLVSDGAVSLSYEGFLYLRKPPEKGVSLDSNDAANRRLYRLLLGVYKKIDSFLPKKWSTWADNKFSKELDIETLSPNQLSALQRGARLAVLCLSPPKSGHDNINEVNATLLPSIYSTFACLGNSTLPMPNIVAQIGAAKPEDLKPFWRGFYTELGSSLEIEKAVSEGLKQSAARPIALFLRQNLGQTFKRQRAKEKPNVTQINAELQQSKETLKRLLDLKDSPLADIVAEYAKGASVQQKELQAKLDPWLEEEEENQP
jgi:hypothetical protein